MNFIYTLSAMVPLSKIQIVSGKSLPGKDAVPDLHFHMVDHDQDNL